MECAEPSQSRSTILGRCQQFIRAGRAGKDKPKDAKDTDGGNFLQLGGGQGKRGGKGFRNPKTNKHKDPPASSGQPPPPKGGAQTQAFGAVQLLGIRAKEVARGIDAQTHRGLPTSNARSAKVSIPNVHNARTSWPRQPPSLMRRMQAKRCFLAFISSQVRTTAAMARATF